MPNFSSLATPLNELVKKNVPFVWGKEHERAFAMLKEKLYLISLTLNSLLLCNLIFIHDPEC